MKDTTKEAVKWIIELYVKTNPKLHTRSLESYQYSILTDFKDVPEELILGAIATSNEKQFEKTKNVMYFRGIVLNSVKEREVKKEMENKNNTRPTKIVY